MNIEQDNFPSPNDLADEADDKIGEAEFNEAFKQINKLMGKAETNDESPVTQESTEEENNNLEKEKELKPSDKDDEDQAEELENREELKQKKASKNEPKWKIKRDKFKILEEKKALLDELAAERAEKQHYQQLFGEALQSGSYHYEQNAISDLEKAKIKKKIGLEEGNADLLLEADIEMNEALNTLREIKKWGMNKPLESNNYPRGNYNPPSQVQYDNYSPPPPANNEIYEQLAAAWLEKHEYLQPDSEKYNSRLAKQVWSYVKTIDDDYVQNNKQHELFSKGYFKDIDNHIKELRSISSKPKAIDGGAPIGGVKNSYYSSPNNKIVSKQKTGLTPDEKMMAHNMGVSEDIWRHYKEKQLKTTATR